MHRLKKVLKPFFKKYDCDGNGNLDRHELSAVFHDLGMIRYCMCIYLCMCTNMYVHE
jgi:hypothetical protein